MPLEALLKQLEKLSAFASKEDLRVSQVSVDWHLKHTLLVIIGIVDQLKISQPKSYRWRFNAGRTYIFWRGSIPRGRGVTPKSVDPKRNIAPDSDIPSLLIKAQERLAIWPDLPAHSHFTHPYFGMLKKSHAHKFLVIHTRHHLSIVQDILN